MEEEPKTPPEEISISRGGVSIEGDYAQVGGDVVGGDKIVSAGKNVVQVSGTGNVVAGDDVIQVQKGAIHVGEGGQLQQTIVNLPRGVRIAIPVAAAALIVIALGVILPVRAVVADGGFESGQSGNRSGKWQLSAGVRIVETDEEDTPDNGSWKASVPAGEAMAQPEVKIPTAPSEMTVWYRSQNGSSRGTLQVRFDNDIVYSQGVAAELEWEQAKFPINHEKYGGRTVTLTVEYVASAGRAGGLLLIAAQPDVNAIWVDNIQISEIEAETLAQVTAAPIATSTSTAVPTLEPTATPRPTRESRPAPTDAPRATITATRAAVAGLTVISPTQTATQTLNFTWQSGDFREAGVNESGTGIWAQEIFVDVAGGTPPYTVVFDASGQRQTGLSFELFGLFCVGQVGTITVRSADGQEKSENITVKNPICPTKTPTPTATATPTKTPTPVPPTVVNGSFEEPAVSPGTYSFFESIPGWSLSLGSSFEMHNNDTFYGLSAARGAQLVELDSDGSSGIYQDLPTTPSATYALHFAFGARPESGPEDNVLEVWWDGALIAGPLSLDGSELSTASWTYYTYFVTATRSTTRLEFRDVGISNTYGTLLDDVYMTLP